MLSAYHGLDADIIRTENYSPSRSFTKAGRSARIQHYVNVLIGEQVTGSYLESTQRPCKWTLRGLTVLAFAPAIKARAEGA